MLRNKDGVGNMITEKSIQVTGKRIHLKMVEKYLVSMRIILLIFITNSLIAQTTDMNFESRSNISNNILKDTELVLGPSLGTAENMLMDKNQIFVFGIFVDSLNEINSAIFDEFGSQIFSNEMLSKITKITKEIISKGQARMIAIVGEGNIHEEKYSNGIKDAIIIKIFHKDTDKVIDYVYPFTREKNNNSEKWIINIAQGLRFVTD